MQAAQKLIVWRDIIPEHYQTPKYQLQVTASSGTDLEHLGGQLIQNSASELLKMELTL